MIIVKAVFNQEGTLKLKFRNHVEISTYIQKKFNFMKLQFRNVHHFSSFTAKFIKF